MYLVERESLRELGQALESDSPTATDLRNAFGICARVVRTALAGPPLAAPDPGARSAAFRAGNRVTLVGDDVVVLGSLEGDEFRSLSVDAPECAVSFTRDAATGVVAGRWSRGGTIAVEASWSGDGDVSASPGPEDVLRDARLSALGLARGLAMVDEAMAPRSTPDPSEGSPTPGPAVDAIALPMSTATTPAPPSTSPASPAVPAPTASRSADVEVCGDCGEIVHAGERYCPRCGQAIGAAAADAVCARCGATMSADVRFCPACGAARPDLVPPPVQGAAPPPSQGTMWSPLRHRRAVRRRDRARPRRGPGGHRPARPRTSRWRPRSRHPVHGPVGSVGSSRCSRRRSSPESGSMRPRGPRRPSRAARHR